MSSLKFLQRIKPWHWLSPWCYRAAIILFLALLVWPVVQSDLAATSWLILLCLALFFLSSGAILAIAHASEIKKTGFIAWLKRGWYKLLFWLWLASVAGLAYLSVSVVRFALMNG